MYKVFVLVSVDIDIRVCVVFQFFIYDMIVVTIK